MQIGGDQLTRERLSDAMHLRIENLLPEHRLEYLGPVTFEFFRLALNFMEKVIFKNLFVINGQQEIGTMHIEKERTLRHSVHFDAMKHYEANKDFLFSFF